MIDAKRIEALREDLINRRWGVSILDDLLDDREELLGLLREVEWSAPNEPALNEDPGEACPVCGRSGREGHAPGCRLASALGRDP